MASNPYHLDIRDLKENIFVTQLNESDEDSNIRRFPIVKESADGLLKSGINTLQKTSMLRQAVAMEDVDKELAEKRENFGKRMEACKIKENQLKMKENQLKDKMQKFDKFLKENEMKRNRALVKYQQEVKNNKLRSRELVNLNIDLENLQKRKDNLLEKLNKFQIYEGYLTSVTKVLPDNYFETVGDSLIHTLIQRYEGLEATHQSLNQKNLDIASETETGQKTMEKLNEEKKKTQLLINSEMSKLLGEQEHLYEKNKQLEQTASSALLKKRNYLGEMGRITMAINNLAEVCKGGSLGKMNYIQKMNMIGRYIADKIGVKSIVENMVKQQAQQQAAEKFITTSSPHAHKHTLHDATPTSDATSYRMTTSFPKKFKPLPPITGTQSQKKLLRKGTAASSVFVEKLTAISESVAE